jgi:hypothetical protein
MAEHPTSTILSTDITMEAVAHALLRLVADYPGTLGRVRAARVVGGYAVAGADELQARRFNAYAVHVPWPLAGLVDLVDAMLDGGLLAQTAGARPVLVLTRAGHHALDALEAHPVG